MIIFQAASHLGQKVDIYLETCKKCEVVTLRGWSYSSVRRPKAYFQLTKRLTCTFLSDLA